MKDPESRSPKTTGDAVAVPSGRLQRIVHLGRAAGGMAFAGAKEKVKRMAAASGEGGAHVLLTAEAAKILAGRLSRLRGAAMKVGQMLSLEGENLLPPEFAQALDVLRSSAHRMPETQLRGVLESEYGPNPLQRFASFEWEPLAAASIGQVHAARALSGEDLVLKIQYPGVRESIDSDVDNLRSLLRLSRLVPKDVDLDDFVGELKRELQREVDYHRELDQLVKYRGLLVDDERYALPTPWPEHSTTRILAMERMFAEPLLKWAETASPESRDRIGELLFDLLLRELFVFGLSQTDPNPANFQIQPANERLVLLDFGATRAVAPDVAALYRLAFEGLMERDRSKLIEVVVALGVHRDEVPEATEIIVDMSLEAAEAFEVPSYDFRVSDLQRRINGHSLKLLKFHGKLGTPPPEYVFFQRKLTGTFLLGRKLGARVRCRALTEAVLS